MRSTLKCLVNRSLNGFWRAKDPLVFVHENLRALSGKFKSKRLSRLVSLWVRGMIKDRLSFKASAGGSRREQVNPAYSSQKCPRCWFVHPGNRRGGTFQCLFCGHGGDSDVVAARNLLDRYSNPEILPWTPRERVKAVLPSRFRRRLERWGFDFPPEVADFAVLSEVGLRRELSRTDRTAAYCSGPDSRHRPPKLRWTEGPKAGQPESETPQAAIRFAGKESGQVWADSMEQYIVNPEVLSA